MGERLATLQQVDAAVWMELARAASDKAHAWRTAVLATIAMGVDGPGAEARTVVLREVDASARTLSFFTDSRSPKVRQLRVRPDASLVMWSQPLGWQLRCAVRVVLAEDGPDVAARWDRLKATPAAQDYMSPLAPGSTLGSPFGEPGHEGHFALATAHVRSIDWLELHPDGHRRALLGTNDRTWLQP